MLKNCSLHFEVFSLVALAFAMTWAMTQRTKTGDSWWRLSYSPACHRDASWGRERLHSHKCLDSQDRDCDNILGAIIWYNWQHWQPCWHVLLVHSRLSPDWQNKYHFARQACVQTKCSGSMMVVRTVLNHCEGCEGANLVIFVYFCFNSFLFVAFPARRIMHLIYCNCPLQVISITDGQIFLETELFYKAWFRHIPIWKLFALLSIAQRLFTFKSLHRIRIGYCNVFIVDACRYSFLNMWVVDYCNTVLCRIISIPCVYISYNDSKYVYIYIYYFITKASYASWSSSCFSKEYARGWTRQFIDTINVNPPLPPWRLVTLRSWVQPPLRPSSQKQWYLQCFLRYRAVKPS